MKALISIAILLVAGMSSAFAEDEVKPQISQLQPIGTTATITSPFTFSGTLSDSGGSGIDKAFFVIKDLETSNWVDIDGSVDSVRVLRHAKITLIDANNGTWSVETDFPVGRYRLYVSVRDKAGNISWWQVRTSVNSTGVADEVKPQISQLQPIGTTATITSPFTFSGTLSDSGGSGIDKAFFVVKDLETSNWVDVDGSVDSVRVLRHAKITPSDANNGTWSVETDFPVGRYRLYVSVRDKAGNISWWQVRTSVTSTGIADEIKPAATLVQLAAQNGASQTFSGTASDQGGSGLQEAFYLIKDLDKSVFVSPNGSPEDPRNIRSIPLNLSDANNGAWQFETSLPEGSYRVYVGVSDNSNNINYWTIRKTFNVDAADEIKPEATLVQLAGLDGTSQTYSGTASDQGGSGLRDAFYLIRDTITSKFLSPDGSVEDPRVIRSIPFDLSDANNGAWQFETSLPEGSYRVYVGVSDKSGNINYWTIRETFTIDDEPEPPSGSVFVSSTTDIVDVSDFYQRDGYEIINVERMDVATRTTPGTCIPGDQSGCTLADVLADIDGDDDFKVDIDVRLATNDLPDDGTTDANAGFRQRGASSRTAPQKSFRIRLEDDLWRSEERIQLNKHPFDQSRMTNKLAFDLMQRLPHLPSLRTQFVNLWIDDGEGPVDQGLYTHVESRAKEYLINRGLDKDDNVYKANFFTFSSSDLAAIQVDADGKPIDEDRFEERIEIDRGKNHTKLVEMLAAVNDPNISIETVIDRYFNRNNVLMWITANILLGQRDAVGQNYFLYNPKDTETFYFLPWDYDGALRESIPLSDGNTVEELTNRLRFGFANEVGNNFLRQFYLMPGAHDQMVRAANEIRRDYFTDEAISNLSNQYANVIRPFVSRSPDIENIGGVRTIDQIDVWEQRWQSFPSVVEENLQRISASPNMPLPHRLKEPFDRNGDTVLWWNSATDITGGTVTYDIQIASQVDFSNSSIIYTQSGIPNDQDNVELVLNRQSLPSGTWYYRVQAYSGDFYQVAKNDLDEGGQKYKGVRKFSVP